MASKNCPTCDSPQPHLHPAVQSEGEVQICRNSWHKPVPAPASTYPKTCHLCQKQIESQQDLDWHGYGNCVDIPEEMLAEMGAEAAPPSSARICGNCGLPLAETETEEQCTAIFGVKPDMGVPAPTLHKDSCVSQPLDKAEAGVEVERLPNQSFLTLEVEQVLAEECTGEDDHDPEPCPKCDRMTEALVGGVQRWFDILAARASK